MTWLNYMSDQFSGLHAIVVPGTLCDSLMILDGLLELQPPGDGGPTMIITDQASYSDQIFGLFSLLGYQFSPAQPDSPTNGSGALTATPTTARSIASPATASTSS